MRSIYANLFIFFFMISSLVYAEAIEVESNPKFQEIKSQKFNSVLGITELVLQNGMKVILKPTNFEPGEVLVRVMAIGGFASLPPEKHASGELAPQIAWESGLDKMTSDQLSVLLYEHSIEFNAQILPFDRIIEGNTGPEELPLLLRIIKMFMSDSRFEQNAFDTVIKQTRESLSKSLDKETCYEGAFKKFNTQNYSHLLPLSEEMLKKADFNTAKQFFEYAFSNPSQFVTVIVGDFDQEALFSDIAKTLGRIPAKNSTSFPLPELPIFPPGFSSQAVHVSGRTDSLARITFPLKSSLGPALLPTFQIASQLLENRLRDTFREKMKSSMGISVSYELPLYPLQNMAWLVIQYRSQPKMVNALKEMILQELKRLREEGPTQAELEKVVIDRKREDEFWLKENSFWLATLANDYLWGWDPLSSIRAFNTATNVTPDKIKQIFNDYVHLDNYSIIYSIP